ncbi:AT hook motif domain-containing protein [Toxoplasma gondii CAST]|uniref:AT hook motif domain-containing protein n=1 Tax=Toxoplasma gondii CAST TaxID=943122 RepID=A0A425HW35_TOXGO|nr:AT hook motif domain-containing protein [Toxoplasma gondii CAST]
METSFNFFRRFTRGADPTRPISALPARGRDKEPNGPFPPALPHSLPSEDSPHHGATGESSDATSRSWRERDTSRSRALGSEGDDETCVSPASSSNAARPKTPSVPRFCGEVPHEQRRKPDDSGGTPACETLHKIQRKVDSKVDAAGVEPTASSSPGQTDAATVRGRDEPTTAPLEPSRRKRTAEEIQGGHSGGDDTASWNETADENAEPEMGLLTPFAPIKRGRGRPRKAPTKDSGVWNPTVPKRGRGRPRKVKVDEIPQGEEPTAAEDPGVWNPTVPKRGRGRPRKVKVDEIPQGEEPTGAEAPGVWNPTVPKRGRVGLEK